MAGFADQVDAFDEADVQIVALSADDEEGARAMSEQEDLAFPVLYGLDPDEIRDTVGTYIEHGKRDHLQPAQFILEPDGSIALACYSSGAVGRLSAEEVLERVDTYRKDQGD